MADAWINDMMELVGFDYATAVREYEQSRDDYDAEDWDNNH